MAENFYTILTNVGKAKIANATALGTKINFTMLKVGDSNGNYYNPTETQENLVHEVWQGNINSITTDAENPNWITIAIVIPSNVGGFTIREVGIFDDEGDMLAIGKYPETYKPQVADGSTKDITIRMILEVSNSASVTLKVDPTVTLATKEDFNALAGTGRTTETVKGNADAITNVAENLNSHKADNAKHLPSGGTVGQIVQKQSQGWGLVDLPPTKDVDNGRYRADFGLEDATLNNVFNSSNVISLNAPTTSIANLAISTNATVTTSAKTGVVISPTGTISKLVVTKFSSCTATTAYIINDSTGSTIANAPFSGNIATFTGLSLTNGINYRIVADSVSSSHTEYGVATSFPLKSSLFNIISGYNSSSDNANAWTFISILATGSYKALTGTVTKAVTPTDIKKWGNVKWTQTTPTNTGIVCDVLDSSDNVLKPNVTSIADLSDINITANSSLKIRWALSRNSAEDESPSIKDVSLTWEGKYTGNGTWEKITDVTLSDNVLQVDFTNLTDYRYFKIVFEGSAVGGNISDADRTYNFYISINGGTVIQLCPIHYSDATIRVSTVAMEMFNNLLLLTVNNPKASIKVNTIPIGLDNVTSYTINVLTFKAMADSSNAANIKAGSKFTLWGCK